MAELVRRRARPPVSCSLCRRRKIRCDRELPCSNCVRSKSKNCSYEALQSYSSGDKRTAPGQSSYQRSSIKTSHGLPISTLHKENESLNKTNSSSQTAGSSHVSDIASQAQDQSVDTAPTSLSSATTPSSQDVEIMKVRIRYLEDQLSKEQSYSNPRTSSSTPMYNVQTITTGVAGSFHAQYENHTTAQSKVTSRSVMHKGRLFGQSHWINGIAVFIDIFELIEAQVREPTSKVMVGLQKCKILGRTIKMLREPTWPALPTADLPPRHVADRLLECYLRSSETVYRILHVPSFKKDYETVWNPGIDVDISTVVQIKLVLAIGAATYDDQFSHRQSAVRWVHEAQLWFSSPEFKSRLNIRSLQSQCLLLLAREIVNVGAGLIWVSAGELLRTAIFMGFHRDPTFLSKSTVFATEMNRRVWNTILEICLRSSLLAGAPPLISLDDFDTAPPRNFDDDQLTLESPTCKPEDEFSQVSIAIALRKTLPHRLKIANYLNGLGPPKAYQEALHLDTQLRSSYKSVCRTLKGYVSSTSDAPSSFATSTVEVIIRHCLSALHIPFLNTSPFETTCAFSRKVVLDNSVKIWSLAYPASVVVTSANTPGKITRDQNDFARLAMCGSGFLRILAIQANLLVAVELRGQIREEETLGPVPLRQDLLAMLEENKTWSLQAVETGEVNVKGYFFVSLVAALVRLREVGKEELLQGLLKTAEAAVDDCLPILERLAGADSDDARQRDLGDGLGQESDAQLPGFMENWDFMMTDSLFTFDNAGPMSWLADPEVSQRSY